MLRLIRNADWKNICRAMLLLMMALFIGCSKPDNSTIQEKWAKRDLSARERNKLVELSEKEPFEKIVPILLSVMIDCQPHYGCYGRRARTNDVQGLRWYELLGDGQH